MSGNFNLRAIRFYQGLHTVILAQSGDEGREGRFLAALHGVVPDLESGFDKRSPDHSLVIVVELSNSLFGRDDNFAFDFLLEEVVHRNVPLLRFQFEHLAVDEFFKGVFDGSLLVSFQGRHELFLTQIEFLELRSRGFLNVRVGNGLAIDHGHGLGLTLGSTRHARENEKAGHKSPQMKSDLHTITPSASCAGTPGTPALTVSHAARPSPADFHAISDFQLLQHIANYYGLSTCQAG